MGPLAGVMVCDYYVIKQRKLNIHELYKAHGIYWYTNGFNWRAFVAFFAAVAPLMPGFAKSIAGDLNVGGAWKWVTLRLHLQFSLTCDRLYAFAWIYGFVNAFAIHFVLCKYVSVPHESIITEAVYPPGPEGYSDPEIVEGSGSDIDTPKDKGAYVHEKEATSPV